MNRRKALRLALAFPVMGRATAATSAPVAADMAASAVGASPRHRPAAASRLATRSSMLDLAAAGSRLVAVGERGRILLSDDAGRQWRQARAVPVSVTLTAVTFAGERLGWATGHAGVVLHTSDGGEHWTLQFDGERAAAEAVREAAAQPDNAPLKRRAKQLLDDGADKPFLAVEFTSESQGMIVGAYGLAFSTGDGGATWVGRMADTDNPKGLHLNALASVGSRTYIAGERGVLLRSDGGSAFAMQPALYDGSWFALGASAEQGVTVAGLRGNAYHSSGDGPWQRVAAGDQTIVAVCVLGGQTLLVSQDGTVRRLGPGGDASVLELPRAPAPMTRLVLAADGGIVAATLRGPLRLADRFPG